MSLWELTIILHLIPWVAKPGCSWWTLDFCLGTGQINMSSNLSPRTYLKAKEFTKTKIMQICTVIKQCETTHPRWQHVLSLAALCLHFLHPWGCVLLSGVMLHKQDFHPYIPGETTDATWKPRQNCWTLWPKLFHCSVPKEDAAPWFCHTGALLLTAEDDCMGISEKVSQATGGRRAHLAEGLATALCFRAVDLL